MTLSDITTKEGKEIEKAWEGFISIWKKDVDSKENATTHEFQVLAHTEDDAKLRGLLKAAKLFPPNDGWTYGVNDITVREVTHEEMDKRIEARRTEIEEESNGILDKAVAEFEQQTGIKLKKPE